MLKKKKQKKYFIVTTIIFLVVGLISYFIGFNSYEDIKYSYTEDNSIDYLVYLKENNFFDEKYLGKDKTYITTLIDFLHLDYNYNVNFTESVNGALEYYLKATITAEKTNNQLGNYWEKSYDLSDKKTKQIVNQKNVNINEIINIDYQKYNELLTSFIDTYKLTSDGYLKIALVVKGNPIINDSDTIDINSEISIKIPLSKIAVEATVNANSNNQTREITKKVQINDLGHSFFKVLFIFDLFLFVYFMFRHITYIVHNKKIDSYNDNVNKIINDYSSIMVKVKKIDLGKINTVKVSTFDDLLVVYNDIRTPVNFIQDDKESRFVIIFENMAWEYIINKGEYDD